MNQHSCMQNRKVQRSNSASSVTYTHEIGLHVSNKGFHFSREVTLQFRMNFPCCEIKEGFHQSCHMICHHLHSSLLRLLPSSVSRVHTCKAEKGKENNSEAKCHRVRSEIFGTYEDCFVLYCFSHLAIWHGLQLPE